mgnify:FL=1
MRYLKRFDTSEQYSEFVKSGNMYKPNTSYCANDNSVYYTPFTGNPSNAKDLSIYYDGEDEKPRTTANCYIVRETGTYAFPLVYGNALYKGVENSAAYTNVTTNIDYNFVNHLGNKITSPYIEEHEGCIVNSVAIDETDLSDGILTDVNLTGYTDATKENLRFVTFTVNSIPETGGNAIIGVKDANGKYIWSWHIWIVPSNVDMGDVTLWNGNNIYSILPYNLGAKFLTGENSAYTITDGTETRSLRNFDTNLYYQFGRKDAFFYDGKNSKVGYETGATTQRQTTIADGIANARTFYTWIGDPSTSDSYTAYDWNCKHGPNLWDASQSTYGAPDHNVQKTIYDPCPIGYCVGQMQKFFGFTYSAGTYGLNIQHKGYSSGGKDYPANGDDSNINAVKYGTGTTLYDNYYKITPVGYRFKRSGHDDNASIAQDKEGILFPSTGYISSQYGSSSHRGSNGRCWSSAPYSMGGAYYLYFLSSYVYPQYGDYRAFGFSVRPLREPNL